MFCIVEIRIVNKNNFHILFEVKITGKLLKINSQ